jgi:proliferating cell nuclear antigen
MISVSNGSVNFSVKGDIGEGDVSLTDLKMDVVKPVKLTFSIKHLLNFTKATMVSDDLNICMSDGCPMMISYGMESGSYVKFYLAPKIDNE